jgi:hypothetical protein
MQWALLSRWSLPTAARSFRPTTKDPPLSAFRRERWLSVATLTVVLGHVNTAFHNPSVYLELKTNSDRRP